MPRLFFFCCLWLSSMSYAQTVPDLDGTLQRADSEEAWGVFHAQAPRGVWENMEGGFKLSITVTEEGITWSLEAPDGTIVGAGEALGATYNGEPPAYALPVAFTCVNGSWIPWVQLPSGVWFCLAAWVPEPQWDFTFGCDPDEGSPTPIVEEHTLLVPPPR